MEEEIRRISGEIARLCRPERIILFDAKKRVSTGELKGCNLCVIARTDDKAQLEQSLYLAVDSPLSYTLILYTPEQWETLTADEQSYAYRIRQKGTVIYE